MTQVYMIANLTIDDADTYRKYEKGFFPILKKYNGSFVTFDDSIEHFEGSTPVQGRIVMFSFPSEEVAREWYNDADYQELSEFRRAGAPLKSLTMVKGLPPRD
ncbi:MAG: hypothetical protein CBD03_05920 [Rhizobiales bacterium TMED143]|nr:hypothetical protein [Rhodobiaceae bacterium]OUV89877.1 MAG: hypothetical protein CBD03_05920 [Rhizobiales bacterium TMED143]CAI8400551.1 MAG: Uncharacterised protein [Rhodobiaceae bacterium UBA7378]